jgi:hypothetical protein
MESSSSITITHGAASLRPLKIYLIFSSLWPLTPETISGAFSLNIGISEFSPAIARASVVLPVPGGPEIKIPLGGFTPNCSKIV